MPISKFRSPELQLSRSKNLLKTGEAEIRVSWASRDRSKDCSSAGSNLRAFAAAAAVAAAAAAGGCGGRSGGGGRGSGGAGRLLLPPCLCHRSSGGQIYLSFCLGGHYCNLCISCS